MIKLRDYQQKAIDCIHANFRSNRNRVLLYCPTGGGKSIIITMLALTAIEQHKRVLIVIHRKKLLHQLIETLSKEIDPSLLSVIAPYHKQREGQVYVAMAQTLKRRKLPQGIDLLIGDEIHEVAFFDIWKRATQVYFSPIWALSKSQMVGLTATPWRMKNSEGFCHYFNVVVKCPSPLELINQKYLSPFTIYTYDLLDIDYGDRNKDADFTTSYLAKVCNEEYNKDIVSKWKESYSDKKTIAFCSNISHAENLALKFNEKGFKAIVVTSKTKEKDVERIYKEYREGIYQILVSVVKLSIGYDEPSVECAIIARPTKSISLAVQMAGRALRLFEGKEKAIILDFAQCFANLSSRKYRGKEIDNLMDFNYVRLCPYFAPTQDPLLKECPQCEKDGINVFAQFCPDCGFEFKNEKPIPEKVLFPDLVEFYSSEDVKQIMFVRQAMQKFWLSPNKDFQSILAKCKSKFGVIPDPKHFYGAIFAFDHSALCQSAYRHFLEALGYPKSLVNYMLNLEFGTLDKPYTLYNGTIVTRYHDESQEYAPKDVIDYLNPKKSYQNALLKHAGHGSAKAINYYYKIVNRLSLRYTKTNRLPMVKQEILEISPF